MLRSISFGLLLLCAGHAGAASNRAPAARKAAPPRTAKVAAPTPTPQPAQPSPFQRATTRLAFFEESDRTLDVTDLTELFIEMQRPVREDNVPRPQHVTDRFVKLGVRAIRERLEMAYDYAGHPDILSVHAEGIGNMYQMVAAMSGNRHQVPEALAPLTAKVERLLHSVVDARQAQFHALRQSAVGRADAISEAEQLAVSMQSDAARIYRMGFAARPVDTEKELDAVRSAVVSRWLKQP